MNDIVALHTAARRYLIERHAAWVSRYAEIGHPTSGMYSDEALDTFPRYNVLAAILEGVEECRPETWPTLTVARDTLVTVASSAHNPFTTDPISDVDARAMAEERALFVQFLNGVEHAQLRSVAALPFRRVLAVSEMEKLRSDLGAAWGVERGHWHPLDGIERNHIVAFQEPYFRRNVPSPALQRHLNEAGTSRVYELREFGPSYELDLAEMEPLYNGAEGFWFAEGLDWVIYASHEASITVGGERLLAFVQSVWPDWEGCVWTSPHF